LALLFKFFLRSIAAIFIILAAVPCIGKLLFIRVYSASCFFDFVNLYRSKFGSQLFLPKLSNVIYPSDRVCCNFLS
jgi:uncharacterized membrane protein